MSFIQDCKLLNSLEDTNDLIFPFELNLIERLYSNDYTFSNEELSTLIKQLEYLKNNKLEDILIFARFRNSEYIISNLTEDLLRSYNDIKIEKTLFKTFLEKPTDNK